jgi:small-conductance mechanosensitive channel
MFSNHTRQRARAVLRSLRVVLLLASLWAATSIAQPVMPPGTSRSAPKQLPVPDPGNLAANWWDYLAVNEPGLSGRADAVLERAGAAVATVPAEQATETAQALERLRVALTVLPDMLAAELPAREPPAPAAESYTTREFLQLDRQIRALQTEIDERRVALDLYARALKNGQRQLDALFAEYVGLSKTDPGKITTGLRLMAQRAQMALADADQRNRRAEQTALEGELAALRSIASVAMTRIVPDPERAPEQIKALIEKQRRKASEQRELIFRLEAARTSAATSPGITLTQLELADLRILAAVIEEAYRITRINRYETELDWLAVTADDLDRRAVAVMLDRISNRSSENERLGADSREWLAAAGRVLALSLRGADEERPGEPAQVRGELTALAQQVISRIDQLRAYIADVRVGADVTRKLLAEQSGWRGWLWLRVVNPAATSLATANAALKATLFRIGDTPVTSYGLLRIVVILVIAVVVSRLLRRLLARFGARRGAQSAAYYTVGRLVHYGMILAALLIGLSSIGLDFSQLALFAGALSIGIGFGLQSIVNNFVSGLIILFERNLKVGDVVQLDSGVRGVVKEINVRSTLLTTNDAIDIVVPNSEFIAQRVTNYTLREPFHRIHIPFGVAYGSDKELVRRVVIEAARNTPGTLQLPGHDPDVWLVKFGDNSLDFELVVWINPAAVTRPGAVVASYLWEIESALRAHGIQIPFPQRDVRLTVERGKLGDLESTPADGPAGPAHPS